MLCRATNDNIMCRIIAAVASCLKPASTHCMPYFAANIVSKRLLLNRFIWDIHVNINVINVGKDMRSGLEYAVFLNYIPFYFIVSLQAHNCPSLALDTRE